MIKFIRALMFLMKGGDMTMVMLYASMIIRGTQKFSKVPETLKADVKKILIDEGLEHLTVE